MNDDSSMTIQISGAFVDAIAGKVIEQIRPLLSGTLKHNEDAILDVKGLASYLNCDENWIYQRTRTHEIPFIKKGKYCLFRKSAIDAWLNQDAIKPLSPFKIIKK
jgi:excisionase family DNA binding protein